MSDVDGLETILRRLDHFDKKGKTAIVRACIRGGLNVIAKQMRKDVPSQVAPARKGIKGRFRKYKTINLAKVGVGVGSRSKFKPDRGGKPGVGIGPNNFHWYVLGTRNRVTKRGANRGSTAARLPGFAAIATRKVSGQLQQAMQKAGIKQLQKQLVKLQSVK